MKTTRVISTISYNTKEFLVNKLNEMVKNHIFSFWAIIKHLPEEDEKKSHWHVFAEPCRTIDTCDIFESFEEFDPIMPEKPLKCQIARKSKFDDWYLYGIHDAEYLMATRGEMRKYQYKKEEFIVSDDDEFNEFVHAIQYKYRKNKVFSELVQSGYSFVQLVKMGVVPIQLICQYEKMYNIEKGVQAPTTYRNGRPNHEKTINMETGEIR